MATPKLERMAQSTRSEAEARAMLNAARAFVKDYPKWASEALTGNRKGARSFAQGFFDGFVRIELRRAP